MYARPQSNVILHVHQPNFSGTCLTKMVPAPATLKYGHSCPIQEDGVVGLLLAHGTAPSATSIHKQVHWFTSLLTDDEDTICA